MNRKNLWVHLISILVVIIWATNYVSGKVVLRELSAMETVFIRSLLALVTLCILPPHHVRLQKKSHLVPMVLMGILGVWVYYLASNVALVYTSASNVSILVATSPFFIALGSTLFLKGARLSWQFFLGFCITMVGIFCVTYQGGGVRVSLLGDPMALLAALAWAVYSLIYQRFSVHRYPAVFVVRVVYLTAVLCMIPVLCFTHTRLHLQAYLDPAIFGNLLYLGVGVSAVTFVVWGWAVSRIGSVKPNLYLYASPVVTVVFAMLVLHEQTTALTWLGIVLAISGLILSQWDAMVKKR